MIHKFGIIFVVGALILGGIWEYFHPKPPAYDPNPNFSLQNVSSNQTAVIPAGYYIIDIVYNNTSANSVTGGIKIGTTSGGTDVVLSQAIAGSSLVDGSTALTKRVFSFSSTTTLYVQANTSWNSANVNVYFVLSKMQ